MIYIVSIILFFSLLILSGFIPIPIGIRHISHLIFSPEDLYKPIIADRFIFSKEGFSKIYLLQPKYLDIYEIGFYNDKGTIPAGYKFSGEVKFEFYWQHDLIFEKIATSIHSLVYAKNDSTKIKKISLTSFDLPLKRKYKKDVKVKVTVLKPDKELEKYKDLKLYIAVSTVP